MEFSNTLSTFLYLSTSEESLLHSHSSHTIASIPTIHYTMDPLPSSPVSCCIPSIHKQSYYPISHHSHPSSSKSNPIHNLQNIHFSMAQRTIMNHICIDQWSSHNRMENWVYSLLLNPSTIIRFIQYTREIIQQLFVILRGMSHIHWTNV